jgi:phosphoribosylaminoimidazolecarboxamide formyltransferase/IMP cyclohydrolase
MGKIQRALVSVSDKTGVVELGEALVGMGVEILSTGGTAKTLKAAGVAVKDVSDFTGFPEMMDGRLKTLHPKVHGGILNRRGNESDKADMKAHGLEPIDMVVVNLYPFEQTIAKEGVTLADAIENIDIGGPTMIRAAAKNNKDVTVIVDPEDYATIMVEMRENDGTVSEATNSTLARKVFQHTSRYDSLIAGYLSGVAGEDENAFPDSLTLSFKRVDHLRYGENPHQRAASYMGRTGVLSLFESKKVQGLDMTFNNYLDANAALMLVSDFDIPTCAIIKHNNPCGVATGANAAEAYKKAYKTDPTSAFGGVVAFNCPVDGETAREIVHIFVEVIIAPSVDDDARAVFGAKANIRVLEMPDMNLAKGGWDIKRVAGGILLQDWDDMDVDVRSLAPVTDRHPTEDELVALEFAWKVCKHVKTNSIVYARQDHTVGIGMGQPSRSYSARSGAINAFETLEGTVVASDGFLPFHDTVDGVKRVGVTAIIQPGGSIKDQEVIKSANDNNLAMLFTDVRHFKH